MDISILYLQTNDEVARTLKDHLDLNNMEFLIVKSASEAFEMLSERQFLLLLVDSYIPDMKLMEFINKCTREYPDLILNVCMDTADPKHVPGISGIRRVTKIYLPPWEIEEIIDGVASSVDAACLENDLKRRQEELAADISQFESTLISLKDTLTKQRFSYYKLRDVLNPYLSAIVKISNAEVLTEEDLHSKGESATETKRARDEYCEFVKNACEKLLRLMTTTKLEAGKLEEMFTVDALAGFKDNAAVALGEISSCLMGDIKRDVVAQLSFCLWLIAQYLKKRMTGGTITVSSRYLNSVTCEYTVAANGEFKECPDLYRHYIESVILTFAKEFVIDEAGTSTYKMIFEL